MRIILVRHGETEENLAGIVQGHLPGRLTERGRRQVELLGRRLAREKLDAIYSSDLARARETARAIARHHPGVKVILTQELRERSLGPYEGRAGSDIDGVDLGSTEGVETSAEIMERARRFLARLRAAHRGGTVLLSGHGVINVAIMAVLTGRSMAELAEQGVMPNAAITVLDGAVEEQESAVQAAVVNDTSHLADDALEQGSSR